MNMNIKEMAIDQLKALKCDHYELIQRSQQTISFINAELEERLRKASEVTAPESKENKKPKK